MSTNSNSNKNCLNYITKSLIFLLKLQIPVVYSQGICLTAFAITIQLPTYTQPKKRNNKKNQKKLHFTLLFFWPNDPFKFVTNRIFGNISHVQYLKKLFNTWESVKSVFFNISSLLSSNSMKYNNLTKPIFHFIN